MFVISLPRLTSVIRFGHVEINQIILLFQALYSQQFIDCCSQDFCVATQVPQPTLPWGHLSETDIKSLVATRCSHIPADNICLSPLPGFWMVILDGSDFSARAFPLTTSALKVVIISIHPPTRPSYSLMLSFPVSSPLPPPVPSSPISSISCSQGNPCTPLRVLVT